MNPGHPFGYLTREQIDDLGALRPVTLAEAKEAVDGDDAKLSTSKPTNPKDAIGSSKLPLHLWPGVATALGCIGLFNGALKYGRANWREAGIRASIYVDAAKRHLDAWFEGEERDPDDGVDHLSAVLACLAIIVDARAQGTLNDDRQYSRKPPGGAHRAAIEALTKEVDRLKKHHAGKSPKHWDISDRE